MRVNWLDRRIAHPGPYLALCLTEGEFIAAMRDCNIKNPPDWIKTEAAQATVHHLSNGEGQLVCVVCLREWEGRNPVEVAGLLVHEAVHAWQEYAERIGEHFPGREQEAYAIQAIAQELMAEFARRLA
jgi:hypothetical protein